MYFGKPINGVPKVGLSAEGTQHREIGIPISANSASWANVHDSTKFGKQFKGSSSLSSLGSAQILNAFVMTSFYVFKTVNHDKFLNIAQNSPFSE
ncbi:hypothetical protein [Staphylococcus warneri]|uniref:hypothetical protein n=1 Tax=Staphylococcus warneri TaxID=1292 RepID=UPI001A903D45|nr:hypothetical protein [Staphylococcus warneri]MBO0376853.1 hypothetical protein [Staphylococcus warneri]